MKNKVIQYREREKEIQSEWAHFISWIVAVTPLSPADFIFVSSKNGRWNDCKTIKSILWMRQFSCIPIYATYTHIASTHAFASSYIHLIQRNDLFIPILFRSRLIVLYLILCCAFHLVWCFIFHFVIFHSRAVSHIQTQNDHYAPDVRARFVSILRSKCVILWYELLLIVARCNSIFHFQIVYLFNG